jgi:hypothetical protein
MTSDAIAEHLTRNVLPEFVDCYLLIADTPDGVPIIRCECHTKEQADRINSIMYAILQSGGVPHG